MGMEGEIREDTSVGCLSHVPQPGAGCGPERALTQHTPCPETGRGLVLCSTMPNPQPRWSEQRLNNFLFKKSLYVFSEMLT